MTDPGAPTPNIASTAQIGGQVRLSADTRIGHGTVLEGRCEVEADVQIGAGCALDAGGGDGLIAIGQGVRIEAGAVVSGAVQISDGARIRAGTVVTRNVPPHAIVAGNPAMIVGYNAAALSPPAPVFAASDSGATAVRGVVLQRMPRVDDLRGNLTVGEFERSVPFAARRYFMVFGVPNAEVRGEHAHRRCHQFLVCAHGHCHLVADDGRQRQEFVLDSPALGLYLPPLTWAVQYRYSADAVLVVFASEYYDPADYIRDYREFLALTADLDRP